MISQIVMTFQSLQMREPPFSPAQVFRLQMMDPQLLNKPIITAPCHNPSTLSNKNLSLLFLFFGVGTVLYSFSLTLCICFTNTLTFFSAVRFGIQKTAGTVVPSTPTWRGCSDHLLSLPHTHTNHYHHIALNMNDKGSSFPVLQINLSSCKQ